MKHLLPPGPPNDFLGLRYMPAMRDDLAGFGARLQHEYGDIVHFRLGPYPCYQLTHPDHIHEVLVRQAKKLRKPARLKYVFGRFEGNGLVISDGEFWARQRRLVQPAFQPVRMQGYADSITKFTREMLTHWGERAEVNFSVEMRKLTLRVVAQTLFSVSVEDDIEELGEAVDAIQDWSIRELNRIVAFPRWLPLLGQPRVRRALSFVDALIRRIIRERRASPPPRDDLLGHMLAAVDTEGDGGGMNDRQLRDELVTLLLAGHETEAAALSWAGWLLASHDDVQTPLAAHVRSVLGDRVPGFTDLAQLAPVEQAFKESLRLYPPIYFFSREVAETVEVAGYELKPTSQVFLSPYLTHHDPRWFPKPDCFDPARFTPEREAQLPACTWFPFGAGPRACVGKSFALLEGTLILACLLQHRRLEAVTLCEPLREWQLSLHPMGGVRLKVTCGK